MTVSRPTVRVDQSQQREDALAGALARLAFGSGSIPVEGATVGPRHLAFLPPDALELDLADPAQRQFGDYELLEKLGQGGMGVVYRARQRSLDRDVAVKLLSAGPWASTDFIERFKREAQSAARMQHPNIVAIYEIGTHEELNFFSMRLVRGQSLAQQLADGGPLPARRAAQLLRTIAEALDYAHRLGVLHLDLKPANVLIDEHGQPQVADFGLARRLDETLTRDNDEVSGTPSYMAPEQAQIRSHKLSQGTDIYGLGAILYELLTGRPPFLAATAQETLKRVIGDEPMSPRQLRDDVPLDLEAVCLKCLAKAPGERYSSARGLADDLGRWLEQRPVSVRPLNALQRAGRWARREPRVAALAGLFLLAIVGGLVATAVQWRRAEGNALEARRSLWVSRAQTAQGALAEGDGLRGLRPLIANLEEMQSAGLADDVEVERRRIGTVLANAPHLVEYLRYPQGTAITAVAFSPDGRRLAIATHQGDGSRKVHQLEVAGAREMWATSTDEVPHVLPFARGLMHGALRYSPDGERVIATMQQQPVLPAPTLSDALAFDARDGRLLMPPASVAHADLVYSDDARRALVRFREDATRRFPESGQLYDVDTWQPLGPRLAHGGTIDVNEWLFAPDGTRLLGSSDFTRFTLFEAATLAPVWRIELPTGIPVRSWRFSPDGSRLALGSATGAVYLVDSRDGSRVELRATPISAVRWLEFSADGRVLAAKAEDGSISVWDADTQAPRTALMAGEGRLFGQVSVHVVGETLFSAYASQLRSWTLSAPAPFGDAAVRGAAQVRSRRQYFTQGYDVHAGSRLLAVGGSDGSLGFLRLPTPVLADRHAAPLPPRHQAFDGERVVGVDGATVQLFDALDRSPRSRAFEHPEPVRFAELAADGHHLATIAGRTLRVLDPVSGALRGEPVVLPATPLRVDIARGAPVLALTTGEYVGDRLHERIHVLELGTGALRPHAPLVQGPLGGFEPDPLGRFVLVTGPYDSERRSVSLTRVDLAGDAAHCSQLPLEQAGDVPDTTITADGRTTWFQFLLPQRRTAVERWNLDDCTRMARLELPSGGMPTKLIASGDGVIVRGLQPGKLSLIGADGSRRDVGGGEGYMYEFAVSADGRLAALARRNSVQLLDLVRDEWLSAPLTAPIAGNDGIAKLSFSRDATRLLGRSAKGRWLGWQLPIATASTAELKQLAGLLDPSGTDPLPDEATLASLRERLRSGDPAMAGAPPASAQAIGAPVRLAAAPASAPDPRFLPLDLAPAHNVPLNGAWPRNPMMGGDLVTIASGAQRLLGVDWRVEGGVQLSHGSMASTFHPSTPRSNPIPVPDVRASRVHVLAFMHIPLRENPDPRLFGRVVLTGADGRETPLEIHVVTHVVTHGQFDRAAPGARVGWMGVGSAYVRDGDATSSQTMSALYAVNLEVPAHVGPIRSLHLDTLDGPIEVPLFFAVTLEKAGG